MVAIRSIETAVPATVIRQSEFRDLLAGQPGYGRLGRRLVGAAFDASAIETRHTVIEEFGDGAGPADPAFLDRESGAILVPGTGARNDAYVRASRPLIVDAARKALAAAIDLDPSDITHVVTVSCTGFSAPGPDYVLVRELGLRPSTQRYHLGFLGCYGAFPALRAAEQFCRADPDAVVLVVSVELCSLHVHLDDDPDTIVAASVFADGAAAAIVTARPAPSGVALLDLDAFETTVIPEGETAMAWSIGDRGFDMVLSSYVPRIVEQHVGDALEPLLERDPEIRGALAAGLAPAEAIDRWAVHPGGRSILDRVQTALGLSDEQVDDSRSVLRDYGNMSSATVLFVLRRLLHPAGRESEALVLERELVGVAVESGAVLEAGRPVTTSSAGTGPGSTPAQDARRERICAMAFGPGLTVETALLTRRLSDGR